MATNVIHGEGKPRFGVPTIKIFDGTNSAANATTITLNGTPSLNSLDSQYGLKNFIIWSFNTDSPAESTHGKILSWNDTTDVITITSDGWSNGTPDTSVPTYIQGKRIDLPYCQRLTETFTPDYIVKKLLNGDIRRIKRGFYYSASLDYSRYLHKDDMELLRDLFRLDLIGGNYGDSYFFTPRVDNAAVIYSVDIDEDSSISFYQVQGHLGHGGVVVNIKGTERINSIPFVDPTIDLTKVIADDDGEYVTDDTGEYIQED